MFASKSREEKILHHAHLYPQPHPNTSDHAHRRYKPRPKQIKTVKKEKYKGNKYIMAMEQENQKKRHERIGFIKKDKQRINKQKHERKSSQIQEIIKSKELKKEKISKLTQEHKLRDLERIQLAKQKSKHRMNLHRNRSHSEHGKYAYKDRPKTRYRSPDIKKMNARRPTPGISSIESVSPTYKVDESSTDEIPKIIIDDSLNIDEDIDNDHYKDIDIGDIEAVTDGNKNENENENDNEKDTDTDTDNSNNNLTIDVCTRIICTMFVTTSQIHNLHIIYTYTLSTGSSLHFGQIRNMQSALTTSTTPLATPLYDSELTPGISPVPDEFPMEPIDSKKNLIESAIAIDQGEILTLDYIDDDTDFESTLELSPTPRILVRSYSDSDVHSTINTDHGSMILSNLHQKHHYLQNAT